MSIYAQYVALLDGVLKHRFLHTPLAAATYLDGLELAAAHQRIGGRSVDLELLGNICQGEESGHVPILPPMDWSGAVIHNLHVFGPMSSRPCREPSQ